MRSVFVQFLPSKHGDGCLSSVDLDLEGWDTARDLNGSICVRPDQAHNRPNDQNVQTLITAWTAAGVTWVTADEALARGYRLGPPYQQVSPAGQGANGRPSLRSWLRQLVAPTFRTAP